MKTEKEIHWKQFARKKASSYNPWRYTESCKAHCFSIFATGNALYHTRCQLGETGSEHDIVIQIHGESRALNGDSILLVYIDKKKVMKVKRLHWNFRGSQTIFMDGTDSTIDMLWDVHDWFFNQASEGRGIFMFTTSRGLLSERFLVEGEGEEMVGEKLETDHRADDFSLLIYATKNS